MSNPIKYSTGSESLALKKGNFYIGTGDVGKGPTSTTGYYNGITPPSGGYTIYLNKASGGPSIYTVTSDAQLISLTNSIAGQSYTTVNECLVYFAGQTDKICVNRDYEGIVTDGLVLNLDAGFTPSYPKNGTTWYDVGGTNNGTLTNGPTFNTGNGGSIVFDGVDDYVNCGNDSSFNLTTELTLECWVKTSDTSQYAHFISKFPVSNCSYLLGAVPSTGYLYFSRSTDGSNQHINGQVNTNVCNGEWNHVVASYNANTSTLLMSVNGTIQSSSLSGTVYVTTTNVNIGRRTDVGQYYSANISNARIYNRALSADEILQNYNAQKGRFGL